jgi:hypothetical protein
LTFDVQGAAGGYPGTTTVTTKTEAITIGKWRNPCEVPHSGVTRPRVPVRRA